MTDDDDSAETHLGRILFDMREQQRAESARASHGSVALDVVQLDDARRSKYASRALDEELARVQSAPEGERNDTLNRAAFSLAQLVGAGALDETQTWDALRSAALRVGLTSGETQKTLRSAFAAGKQKPRQLPAAQLVPKRVDPLADEPTSALPPSEPPSSDELVAFWDARPLLAHIERYSRARRVAPWAVLGCVLARVVTATEPSIVLPPLIGGQASLNLFVGLVGPSGSGKGAAERVAAECLSVGPITSLTTGSGEGIGHAYRRRDRKGDQVEVNQAVLFSVPEVDTLSALGARKGATLMPELRRAWSGEALGFQYADPTRRLIIEGHSYRMCLVVGIQPARAGALLDDSDGGTPQRVVWCSAIDRDAPDVAPEAPKPYGWKQPSLLLARHDTLTGRHELHVCESARKLVDDVRLARLRGEGTVLDGHALLARLKIGAALAIADGRLDVSEDDWRLADVIMRQSDATRAEVAQTLASAARESNVAKAEAEAHRAVVIDERAAEAALKRASKAVLAKLRRSESEWVASSVVRRGLAHRDRGSFDAAVEALLSTGQIEEQEADRGRRLRVV
jgi:hypothetical protein